MKMLEIESTLIIIKIIMKETRKIQIIQILQNITLLLLLLNIIIDKI